MLADSAKWPYQFGLTYSVTLSSNELETSLVVRNTGSTNYDFHVLFHTYLAVEVSEIAMSSVAYPYRLIAYEPKKAKITNVLRFQIKTGHNHDLGQRARIRLLPRQDQIRFIFQLAVRRNADNCRRDRPNLLLPSGASHHGADPGR